MPAFEQQKQSDKRLVKNTVYLYSRVVLLLFFNLYITKILLQKLGVSGYGAYNLLGSLIIFLTLFNSAVSGAVQRFIAYGIGQGNSEKANQYYSASYLIFFILVGVILFLGETVGFFYVCFKMKYPAELRGEILWTYQITLVTCVAHTMLTPYNALLIATERINFYSIISTVEVIGKFIAAVTLTFFISHRIVLYAGGVLASVLLTAIVYFLYVKINLRDFVFQWKLVNFAFLKELCSFSFWYIIANSAFVIMSHGINILINNFFGVDSNATYGIAVQVSGAILLFINNLRIAMDPILIKVFASNDMTYFKKLFFLFGKITLFFLLFIFVPMYYKLDYILHLWLGDVQSDVLLLCKLMLVYCVLQTPDIAFGVYFRASGNIAMNMLYSGGCYLLVLPLTYTAFKLGAQMDAALYVQIALSFLVSFVIKVILLKKYADYGIGEIYRLFFFPCIGVLILSGLIFHFCSSFFTEPLFMNLVMSFLVWTLIYLPILFFCGVNKEEQAYFLNMIKSIHKEK